LGSRGYGLGELFQESQKRGGVRTRAQWQRNGASEDAIHLGSEAPAGEKTERYWGGGKWEKHGAGKCVNNKQGVGRKQESMGEGVTKVV